MGRLVENFANKKQLEIVPWNLFSKKEKTEREEVLLPAAVAWRREERQRQRTESMLAHLEGGERCEWQDGVTGSRSGWLAQSAQSAQANAGAAADAAGDVPDPIADPAAGAAVRCVS